MRSLRKNLFPDAIVFRTRRSAKNRQSQSDSGVSNHEQGVSVPPANTVPAGSTATNYNPPTTDPESNYRIASNVAQFILPMVGTVAGAIPLAGPPMQAAIDGLLAILRAIDSNMQSKKDLAKLESRLHRLSRHICNAPTAGDPGEKFLRDSLISVLQDTSSELTRLKQCGTISIPRVTQAIIGCSNDINDYLLEYSALSQMQIGHKVNATFTAVQTMQLPRTNALGVVTLMDATGYEHSILLQHCTSFQQLNMMLRVIFQPDSIQARAQRKYVESGEYDLSIDHGMEVTQLTSDHWPSIEVGTKIVMSMVAKQRRDMEEAYQCHSCKTRNDGTSADEICLIDCGGCGRRFQASTTIGYVEDTQETICEGIGHGDIYSTETTAVDMQLIRNWHVRQEVEINKLKIWRDMCMAWNRDPDDEDVCKYDYSRFADFDEERQHEMDDEGDDEIVIRGYPFDEDYYGECDF